MVLFSNLATVMTSVANKGGKNRSEIDSSSIVSLCCLYSHRIRMIEMYNYFYSYRPLCKRAYSLGNSTSEKVLYMILAILLISNHRHTLSLQIHVSKHKCAKLFTAREPFWLASFLTSSLDFRNIWMLDLFC